MPTYREAVDEAKRRHLPIKKGAISSWVEVPGFRKPRSNWDFQGDVLVMPSGTARISVPDSTKEGRDEINKWAIENSVDDSGPLTDTLPGSESIPGDVFLKEQGREQESGGVTKGDWDKFKSVVGDLDPSELDVFREYMRRNPGTNSAILKEAIIRDRNTLPTMEIEGE